MSSSKTPEQLEQEKRTAAHAALRYVRNHMILGLGSGSTATYFLELLAEAVRRDGLTIEAVASSLPIESKAAELGLRICGPRRGLRIDLDIDGADEIAPDLSLIKGAGGALLREKIVARHSRRFFVIADSSKRVVAARPAACSLGSVYFRRALGDGRRRGPGRQSGAAHGPAETQ